MTHPRAALPGLIGIVLLLVGLASIATGVQSSEGGALVDHLRTASLPTGIGILMLLAFVAIGRGTRLGLLLGMLNGVLMVAAGLAVIVLEIPFLQAGGEGAAFGSGFVVVAAVWILVWLLYEWRLWAARSRFATGWVPDDRRLAAVMAMVAVVATGTFLGIGAVQATASNDAIQDDAQARAEVEGTALVVRVLDSEITPAKAGAPATVESLTFEIDLRSPLAYTIAAAPTLCLTSLAIFQDPEFKPGMLCWGTPGPQDALGVAFASLTVPRDTTTVRLELRGAGSPCAFPPGPWNAELTLAPTVGQGANGIGPAPAPYSIDATFQVGDGSIAPPPSGTPAAELGCLGVSP